MDVWIEVCLLVNKFGVVGDQATRYCLLIIDRDAAS